jgi:hypothetical protein
MRPLFMNKYGIMRVNLISDKELISTTTTATATTTTTNDDDNNNNKAIFLRSNNGE